jgi:hypothetical protein
VIQLKQFRALHQPSGKLYLFDLGLPLIELISRRKFTKLNRQIEEVEHLVTCRKQTTETWANRQKIQKRPWQVGQLFGRCPRIFSAAPLMSSGKSKGIS